MPVNRLKTFLDKNRVKYVSITHSIAYTAVDTASSAHVSAQDFAKTVIVFLDRTMAMAVLRGVDKLDLHRLRSLAGAAEARLATEDEFRGQFPGVDVGAMPPFGNLFGLPVYADEALAGSKTIAFNAGTHSEVICLQWADYHPLVGPVMARISSDEGATAT